MKTATAVKASKAVVAKVSKTDKAIKAQAAKARKAKKPSPTISILLPNGEEMVINAQSLGGYIVATYDFGMDEDGVDLTEAMTGKDCKAVGNVFLKQLKKRNCYRPD
jgi:hypothetical protein